VDSYYHSDVALGEVGNLFSPPRRLYYLPTTPKRSAELAPPPPVFQEVTISSSDAVSTARDPSVPPPNPTLNVSKPPFIVFENNALQLSSYDGRKYMVKSKNQPQYVYVVTLYGNEFDSETPNQKPTKKAPRRTKKGTAQADRPVPITPISKPTIVVTLNSDSDHSDIEILEVIPGRVTIKQEPQTTSEQSVPVPVNPPEPLLGKVERKRNTIRQQGKSNF